MTPTPKEKAKELYLKFIDYTPADIDFEHKCTIQCAIILVNEIQKLPNIEYSNNKYANQYDYWQEVKNELLNLK